MKCPKCGLSLLKERGGDLTLKAAILILPAGGGAVQARCPGARCDGLITVQGLTWTALQSPAQGRRLLVRRSG